MLIVEHGWQKVESFRWKVEPESQLDHDWRKVESFGWIVEHGGGKVERGG